MENYNYESHPYLLLKDECGVHLVNAKTLDIQRIAKVSFEVFSSKSSLVEYYEEGQMRILTLGSEEKKDD